MLINNPGSVAITFSDLKIPACGSGQSIIAAGGNALVFNEDAEKSNQLKALLLAGTLTKTNMSEPNDGTGVADVQNVLMFDSAVSVGGAASEALTVTGLLATDTILSLTQKVPGANSTALNGFTTVAANALTVSWTANPGAGAIVRVAVLR